MVSFLNMTLAKDWTGSTSGASFAWVQNQLQECTSRHSRCNSNGRLHGQAQVCSELESEDVKARVVQPQLPTRVLDLGLKPKDIIKLVESSDSLIGHYNCLSHCWGSKQPLVTTRKNITAWKKRIPWKALPKTFQDAVAFTRSLNIRYLWIDCLCIIQGDVKDWQKQAGKMAEIYQNSFLVLAATASHDCQGGLFRTFSRPKSYLIQGIDSFNREFDIYVRKRTTHWSDKLNHEEKDLDVDEEFPLLTRAWVYQERLLSKRVLHFCSDELVWECNEESTCQCGCFNPETNPKEVHARAMAPVEVNLSSIKALFKQSLMMQKNKKSTPLIALISLSTAEDGDQQESQVLTACNLSPGLTDDDSDGKKPRKHWHQIVEDYSKLKLDFTLSARP